MSRRQSGFTTPTTTTFGTRVFFAPASVEASGSSNDNSTSVDTATVAASTVGATVTVGVATAPMYAMFQAQSVALFMQAQLAAGAVAEIPVYLKGLSGTFRFSDLMLSFAVKGLNGVVLYLGFFIIGLFMRTAKAPPQPGGKGVGGLLDNIRFLKYLVDTQAKQYRETLKGPMSRKPVKVWKDGSGSAEKWRFTITRTHVVAYYRERGWCGIGRKAQAVPLQMVQYLHAVGHSGECPISMVWLFLIFGVAACMVTIEAMRDRVPGEDTDDKDTRDRLETQGISLAVTPIFVYCISTMVAAHRDGIRCCQAVSRYIGTSRVAFLAMFSLVLLIAAVSDVKRETCGDNSYNFTYFDNLGCRDGEGYDQRRSVADAPDVSWSSLSGVDEVQDVHRRQFFFTSTTTRDPFFFGFQGEGSSETSSSFTAPPSQAPTHSGVASSGGADGGAAVASSSCTADNPYDACDVPNWYLILAFAGFQAIVAIAALFVACCGKRLPLIPAWQHMATYTFHGPSEVGFPMSVKLTNDTELMTEITQTINKLMTKQQAHRVNMQSAQKMPRARTTDNDGADLPSLPSYDDITCVDKHNNPISLGSRVVVDNSGRGTVVFIGKIHVGAPITRVGVALDEARGKHDGEVRGKRYFTTKPRHAALARPNHTEICSDEVACVDKNNKPISVGARIAVNDLGIGTVVFIGRIHVGAPMTRVGVDLDEPRGKHDGKVQGKRYFTTRPMHAVLARPRHAEIVDATSDGADDTEEVLDGFGGGDDNLSDRSKRPQPLPPPDDSDTDEEVLDGFGTAAGQVYEPMDANHSGDEPAALEAKGIPPAASEEESLPAVPDGAIPRSSAGYEADYDLASASPVDDENKRNSFVTDGFDVPIAQPVHFYENAGFLDVGGEDDSAASPSRPSAGYLDVSVASDSSASPRRSTGYLDVAAEPEDDEGDINDTQDNEGHQKAEQFGFGI